VPISKINRIKEVLEDPYVVNNLLFAKDPKTGTEITLAPPPVMTEVLKINNRYMSFPPRFGEHNEEIYGKILGLSKDKISELAQKKII